MLSQHTCCGHNLKYLVQTVEEGVYKSIDMVWNCEHINIPDQFSKEKDQGVNKVKT